MKKPKAVAASLLLFCAVTGLTGCPQNVYGPAPDYTKDDAEQTQESQVEEETEEESTSESQE